MLYSIALCTGCPVGALGVEVQSVCEIDLANQLVERVKET